MKKYISFAFAMGAGPGCSVTNPETECVHKSRSKSDLRVIMQKLPASKVLGKEKWATRTKTAETPTDPLAMLGFHKVPAVPKSAKALV